MSLDSSSTGSFTTGFVGFGFSGAEATGAGSTTAEAGSEAITSEAIFSAAGADETEAVFSFTVGALGSVTFGSTAGLVSLGSEAAGLGSS